MIAPRLTPRLASQLVEAAVRAPSARDAQPWRFTARLDDQLIELRADPARMPQHTDPRGRAVHLSCGSALFNLRLAVSCAGAEPVTRLLPGAGDPQLLATVRLARPRRAPPRDRELYRQIFRAPAAGRPPAPGRAPAPVRAPVWAALREAAALEGAALACAGQLPADRITEAPTAGLCPGTAQVAVLSTGGDTRADWLRAGQALQRVLLLAACYGVAGGSLGPAAATLDHAHDPGRAVVGQHAQLVLWLGPGPAGPAGRPRPVRDVLRISPAEPDGLLAGRC